MASVTQTANIHTWSETDVLHVRQVFDGVVVVVVRG